MNYIKKYENVCDMLRFMEKIIWRLHVMIRLANYLIRHTSLYLEFSYCIVSLYQTSACLCLEKICPYFTKYNRLHMKIQHFFFLLLAWSCLPGFFRPIQVFLPDQPLCFQWICHKCLYSWLLQKVSLQLFFSWYMEWISLMCKLLYRDPLFPRLVASSTWAAVLLCSCSSVFTVQLICICKNLAWCSLYLHLH